MQLTIEQTQNLLALLKMGKFTLNADEATVLAILKQDLEKGLLPQVDLTKTETKKK